MIKPLAALIAATTFAMPAVARVEASTPLLLQTLNDYGIAVRYNHSDCSNGFQGRYSTARVMDLCYSGAPSAEDHDTVRHEVWHYLQYCATPATSNLLHPLLKDRQEHAEFTSYGLSGLAIERIRDNYRDDHERTELEAFAAAEIFSAEFIGKQVRQYCTPI